MANIVVDVSYFNGEILMYKLINGNDIPMKEAANFIAQWNQQDVHHIGYCGTTAGEIVDYLATDLTDVPYENSFLGVVDNGKMIGLLGFDADLEDAQAELWGPFVDPGYDANIAIWLWDELLRIIPLEIKHVSIFSNIENSLATEFAERLNFEQKTDQIVLLFERGKLGELPKHWALELMQQGYGSFIDLHDNIFPDTYFNGHEIIDRLTATQKVFVIKSEERLAGYVYVEANPEYGEGSIEFIGVDSMYRGNSYGKSLLATAVQWLFTFDSINEIQLCVAANNKQAIGLYQSVGFRLEHELHFFVREM
ncbi:GNAT family N-acetyltransferase [Lentibacillus sp. Marseille-P4043]|uniref:GNAT family N-acetyltransferase n=1 Tax=Lentibacillus sp. Marseille-P4043 TaxID=2040293 RepID=UPI000D0B4919|nr:GNAT family N-acetyltransferase [Lentibacillus sp. Marseille-P4043]